MSQAENICLDSLKKILFPREEIKINYRPNWLKYPVTKKNLELDFYLPEYKVGIEIQGQHHFIYEEQMKRDKFKSEILREKNIYLLKTSIFQITPIFLYNKFCNLNKYRKLYQISLRKFDINWTKNKRLLNYKNNIIGKYGQENECYHSPRIFDEKQELLEINNKLKYIDIILVRFKNNTVRARIVDLTKTSKIKVRILGTTTEIYIKKRKVFELNGDELNRHE